VGALIHDGMHVEGKLSASLLQECADAVHHQTSFRIELEVKPFDNHEALLQGIQMVSDDYDREAAMIILEAMKTSDIDQEKWDGLPYQYPQRSEAEKAESHRKWTASLAAKTERSPEERSAR
jgi:hypothetical protein